MHVAVRHCLTLACVLTSSGIAFARRPPALVEQQEAANRITSRCLTGHEPSAPGYRDMHARRPSLAPSRAARPAPAAPSSPALVAEVQTDHVVLVCRGAVVHASPGYRDMYLRVPETASPPIVAAVAPGSPGAGLLWRWRY